MKQSSVKKMTFSAILIALGILIPMVMPVKLVIPPASYTLASHVPVFLAMFISPASAVAVALGTAFGFFMSFPPIIAFRALSHVIFAVIGAYILKKNPLIVKKPTQAVLFNLGIGFIHAAFEALVVSVFYLQGGAAPEAYNFGYVYFVLVLIFVGGFVHSLVDFVLAYIVADRLSKQFDIPVFTEAKRLQREALKMPEFVEEESVLEKAN